jgi:hypothetical protein
MLVAQGDDLRIPSEASVEQGYLKLIGLGGTSTWSDVSVLHNQMEYYNIWCLYLYYSKMVCADVLWSVCN